MPNNDDDGEAKRFSNRSFDVTLYSLDSDGQRDRKAFSGQTNSISREGMGVRGELETGFDAEDIKNWEEETFFVKFHSVRLQNQNVKGTVKMVGESEELHHRWYIGMKFARDIDITSLR